MYQLNIHYYSNQKSSIHTDNKPYDLKKNHKIVLYIHTKVHDASPYGSNNRLKIQLQFSSKY